MVAEVLAAAEERARALADGNAATLERVLHPDFAWTSYTGESFDRAAYIRANTGVNRWHGQALTDVTVTVVGDTAVLRCVVADDVTTTNGREVFRMPLTQVWVRSRTGWLCLAGHAGPRLAR